MMTTFLNMIFIDYFDLAGDDVEPKDPGDFEEAGEWENDNDSTSNNW